MKDTGEPDLRWWEWARREEGVWVVERMPVVAVVGTFCCSVAFTVWDMAAWVDPEDEAWVARVIGAVAKPFYGFGCWCHGRYP